MEPKVNEMNIAQATISKIAFGGIEQKVEINGEPTQTEAFKHDPLMTKVAAVACYCGKTYAVTDAKACEHRGEGRVVKYSLNAGREESYVKIDIIE
jgi:hypothetical protein